MKKLLTLSSAMVVAAGAAHAQTINILMESVPDTRFVQEVLPQYTELRDLARLAPEMRKRSSS